ncbi:hypothetical protein MMC17_008787 [Xylographa soralifera]|nr:hypothetical protein [Xylographa soralifera]
MAQNYTVILLDNRGMGDSSIPADNDYTAETVAGDIKGVLDFLNITETYIFGHDKGAGLTSAFAAKYASMAKMVSIAEYPLPGFGYETVSDPIPSWSLYSNWQLGFFGVPDAAQYFIQGRERQMLSWYFFHSSYSGTTAVSKDDLTSYTDQISKPGFLRSGLTYFEETIVGADAAFFNSTIGKQPLAQPLLVMGGEASFAPVSLLQQFFNRVGSNISYDVVPKAGHWIGDENPAWVANRLTEFFGGDPSPLPSIDLSYLTNKVTLV